MKHELLWVPAAPPFPNSALPVIVYPGVFADGDNLSALMAERMAENGWPGAWVNGVYGFDHFHAEAHEILGCARGWVTVRLGGPNGPSHTLRAGDFVLLPAGVGHRNMDASRDYLIVGSYPKGQSPDLQRGDQARYEQAARSAQAVPLPASDPVFGLDGPAVRVWGARRQDG